MFYAIICVICVKHEYLRKKGQVRTASGPLQLRRDRYSCVTGSEATGPPRPFTRPTRPRAGRHGRDAAVTSPGVVGPTMPGLSAGRDATQIIRSHYANKLRNIHRYYADITQTLRRLYANTLRKSHNFTQLYYAEITQYTQTIRK